jgi:hypothetical protein
VPGEDGDLAEALAELARRGVIDAEHRTAFLAVRAVEAAPDRRNGRNVGGGQFSIQQIHARVVVIVVPRGAGLSDRDHV